MINAYDVTTHYNLFDLTGWQNFLRRDFGMFDLCGYSERGMMNALFYEIRGAGGCPEQLEQLSEFLGQCRFPFQGENELGYPFRKMKIRRAKVFIEQSFSDFGDADALVLLDEGERDTGAKHAIYIEAKVKTAQRAGWSIDEEWRDFLAALARQIARPNLFIQLYRKLRLTQFLLDPDGFDPVASVPSGWSLGMNPVVRRAANELGEYCRSSWYLMIVPETCERMGQFFGETLQVFVPAEESCKLPGWGLAHLPDQGVARWGYLCWEKLEQFCRAEIERKPAPWLGVTQSFDYNRQQIYGEFKALVVRNPTTRELINAFLRGLTNRQRSVLHLLAQAGGAMRQGDLVQRLGAVNANQLQALKAGVNKACDRIGIPHLLPRGVGAGDQRMHEICPTDREIRGWVIQLVQELGGGRDEAQSAVQPLVPPVD